MFINHELMQQLLPYLVALDDESQLSSPESLSYDAFGPLATSCVYGGKDEAIMSITSSGGFLVTSMMEKPPSCRLWLKTAEHPAKYYKLAVWIMKKFIIERFHTIVGAVVEV